MGRLACARLAPGASVRVGEGPLAALVSELDGQAYAIEDRCHHEGASLARGSRSGCRVRCPAHGWDFDVRTGEQLAPQPGGSRQRAFEVAREGDDLVVLDPWRLELVR